MKGFLYMDDNKDDIVINIDHVSVYFNISSEKINSLKNKSKN